MTLALTLTAMTLLNWISVDTAAKVYLVMVVLSYLSIFAEVLTERRRERP
jgi:glucose-6-phosphate-specific signal transduction histidine kinase